MVHLDESIAIRIEGVTKKYRLGQFNSTTFTHELQSWWAKKRGKEDPNRRIDEDDSTLGKDFWALKGVDLTIRRGETVGIVGSNGAGKSTLLKLISHITAPTQGRILINGRISSMLEVGTGFNPEMTGRENIYINGAILGMTKAEIDAKIQSIIDFSECGAFIDTPVKRYSSGMYVKLAFSVAAHLDNEIVIMDEVLAVGDARFQKKCVEKMRSLAADGGRTILFVSHSMPSVRKVCARCVVLQKGRVAFDGDTEDAIQFYTGCENITQTDVDLAAIRRSDWYVQRAVLMRLQAADRTQSVYKQGEPIRLRLRWKTLEDVAELYIAATVRTTDEIPVGRTRSSAIRNVRANVERESELTLDLNALMPGKYELTLELNQIVEGKNNMLDGLVSCYTLTLLPTDPQDAQWNSQFWGYVRFAQMEIRDL